MIVVYGGYRRRREQTLVGIDERTASKVSRSGRMQKLDPMNPAERRIVHSALQGYPASRPSARVLIQTDILLSHLTN